MCNSHKMFVFAEIEIIIFSDFNRHKFLNESIPSTSIYLKLFYKKTKEKQFCRFFNDKNFIESLNQLMCMENLFFYSLKYDKCVFGFAFSICLSICIV